MSEQPLNTGIASDILSRVYQDGSFLAPQPSPDAFSPPAPYYVVEVGNTLTTAYAAGTDYDAAFEADSQTIYPARYKTAAGEISLPSFTTTYPSRALIRFNCIGDVSVKGILLMNGGNVQIKSSGLEALMDYAATSEVAFRFQDGANYLRISTDGGGTTGPVFIAKLFDGKDSVWVE